MQLVNATERSFAAESALRDELKERGVPPRLIGSSWDRWQWVPEIDGNTRRKIEAFQNWRGDEQSATFVTLSGTPGAGKSHMAAATLRRYYEARDLNCWYENHGQFVRVSRLLHDLRSEVKGNGSGLLERLMGRDLLILDDFGAQKQTDWTLDTLYLLISERYDEMRPTVLTTNHGLNWVADNIDPRIASRMADGLVIRLELPDYRAGS